MVNRHIHNIYKTGELQESATCAKIAQVQNEGKFMGTDPAKCHTVCTFRGWPQEFPSIVGHESTAMTRHYYHENLDALKSAVAAIQTL